MALDGFILHRLIQTLTPELPLRIQRIYDVSEHELLFSVRSPRGKHQLLISAHSVHNRLLFSNQTFSPPSFPSPFVMLLRKHCEGGTLQSIEQIGLDRIVRLQVRKRDALGDVKTLVLMIELMGKYANVILVDHERIVDALKRIPLYENSKRSIQPGAHYSLPEAHVKADPRTHPDIDASRSFVEQFHGFSPLLAREFEHRRAQQERFEVVLNEVLTSDTFYLYPHHEPALGHVIELKHLNQSATVTPLMNGLDQLYQYEEERQRIKERLGDLNKVIQRELKKTRQKLPKLYDDLARSEDFETFKAKGEALYAYASTVSKGRTFITLKSLVDERDLAIDLDPKLDGKANAAKYFQKYQKAKKGLVHIQQQLAKTQQELEYFEGLAEQLSLASLSDASDLQLELAQGGYLRTSLSQRHTPPAPKVMSFSFDAHTRILVGKNNRQNDHLSFKLARRDDWWFHAKDYHGAHVVLTGPDPCKDAIEWAARLAAYFSKAKTLSGVEVQMTRIKHLKKPPQAKPGQVLLSQVESLFIRLEGYDVEAWMMEHSA